MSVRYWLFISCICLSACVESSNAEDSMEVPHSVLSSGIQTGIDSQNMHVVRDETDYAALLSSVQLAGEIPNPDFTKSRLVAVFTTLNSCYSLEVRNAQDVDGSTVITVGVPDENAAGCNPVVGNAYRLVQVPQSPQQVSVMFKAN